MKNSKLPQRKNIRLEGYDYATNGYYFVTINFREFRHVFGNIENKVMYLSPLGEIIVEEWEFTGELRQNVKLHEYVVMPNHFHAIIEITYSRNKNNIPGEFKASKHTLSSIIRAFKASVTKRNIEMNPGDTKSVWHNRFHDRIIRNNRELQNKKRYVLNNVKDWKG